MKNGNGDFSTKGFWIIPFILGWSKSVVSSFGRSMGLMFTLHITPYFYIGISNPHPCQPSIDDEDYHHCSCGCCDEDMELSPEMENEIVALEKADEFVRENSEKGVIDVFQIYDEELSLVILFTVNDESVEIPEEFEGFKTLKGILSKTKKSKNDDPE
jgi:hypothetical protein